MCTLGTPTGTHASPFLAHNSSAYENAVSVQRTKLLSVVVKNLPYKIVAER